MSASEECQVLKEWAETQPHLPECPDELLHLFLIAADNNQEAARTGMDSYFTVRTHAKEAFSDRDPTLPELEEVSSLFQVAASPKLHPDGHVVLFARLLERSADNFVHPNALKAYFMAQDWALRELGSEAKGFIFVFDLKGMSLGHLARINLLLLRQYLVYTQDAFPSKVIGNHMINVVPATETLVNIMKPIMKKELSDKLFVHSTSMETFYKYVPKEVLPKDYDGDLDFLEVYHDETRRKMIENKDWYLEEEKLRVDESKRPGRPLTSTDVFGVEGSFRTLSID